MTSSILITKTIKEISVLINEIQDDKRIIYTSKQQNQIEQSLKKIKSKMTEIDDKVKSNLLITK